jgi:hypothetical protein
VALTWDGARWPIGRLSAPARAFLGGPKAPEKEEVAELFRADEVGEIRVCWVPRLAGGDEVLAASFQPSVRVNFRVARTKRFGDVLGMVYRREAQRRKGEDTAARSAAAAAEY